MTLRPFMLALCGLLGILPARAADAQDWTPTRPVRIVVPFTPAGSSDQMARILAERVGRSMGARWLVENRPGAGGNIGIAAVAASEPDGTTIGWCTLNCAGNTAIYAHLPFDIERDLAPVIIVAKVMNLFVVRTDLPVRTLQEFITYAQQHRGEVNYGSGGFGSSIHLGSELLNGRYGMGMVHVPFGGGSPVQVALMAGQIDMTFDNLPALIGLARDGRVRPLAVSGERRDPALPDVPTFAEAGVPDFVMEPWFGLVVPARTPPHIVRRINALMQEALEDDTVKAAFANFGAQPVGGSPEDFARLLHSEIVRWNEVVDRNNIQRIGN